MKDYYGFLEDYKYVKIKPGEYPGWNLWDSYESIYIEGMYYKNIVDDPIYFKGIRYLTNWIEDENVESVREFRNAILKVDFKKRSWSAKECLEIATKLQERVDNGYTPKISDVMEFVGAEVYYCFKEEGTEIRTFKCEDIDIYLEEKSIYHESY